MAVPIPDTTRAALTTSAADVFTVPADTVRIITLVQACNVDGTDDVDVTLQWTDSSAADVVTRLAYQVTVEAKNSRTLLAGFFALRAGDKLQGLASAASDAELTVNYYDESVA